MGFFRASKKVIFIVDGSLKKNFFGGFNLAEKNRLTEHLRDEKK